jgi:eukaryotic-like serine/threonine-protein kinase
MKERFHRLVGEVHRRSLWQVLSVYVVASWVIYEVVVNLVEGLGLPDWVAPTALVLLLLGLPLVLATAIVQEGGPAGFDPGKPGPMSLWGLESAGEAIMRTSDAGLDGGSPAEAVPPEPLVTARPPSQRPWFTWRRTLTGIILGFAGLGVAVSGFMGMRMAGLGPAGTLIARGQLEPLARVLVADFGAPGGDSLLAGAVAEAFRIDLPQSPVLQVVDRSELGPPLRRMAREPGDRLDEAVARELAVREGVPVVLLGEVARAGPGFQVTVRLVTADSGMVLFRGREAAADAAGVLPAVERLSARLRERAGESLRSIRASPPLRRVTTPSLEALQLYSAAGRANMAGTPEETQKAIRLLEQALDCDSLFAMAWTALATNLANAGIDRARGLDAYTRAVELEGRLTQEERDLAWGAYHRHVQGDTDRAIDAYERVLASSPDHAIAHNNLGVLYASVGDYVAAARSLERSVRSDSAALSLANLFQYKLGTGDTAGARQVLAARRRLHPDNHTNSRWAARLAYMQGDFTGARDTLLALTAVAGPLLQPTVLEDLAALECRAGHARECIRLIERASVLFENSGRPDEAILKRIQVGFAELYVLGRPDLTIARVNRSVRAYREAEVPAVQAAWTMPALLLALAGEPAQAQELRTEWRRRLPAGIQRLMQSQAFAVEGAILRAEGHVERGLETQRRSAERTVVEYFTLPILAVAYDQAGQPDSALVLYRRYEGLRHWNRPTADQIFLALALERMARLHEDRGDIAEASLCYERFIELWRDADPELQPRVDAARRALTRLTAEGRAPTRR